MDPEKSLGTIVTLLIPSNGTSYFYLTKFQKVLFNSTIYLIAIATSSSTLQIKGHPQMCFQLQQYFLITSQASYK